MLAERPEGTVYHSEDYAFCERARRSGLAIHADTSVRVWHIGDYRYGWEDAGGDPRRFTDYVYRIAEG